jgi:predicted nucleic acid-binding protein
MVTYVLDSSAILRYLDGEAGADRVAEIIASHLDGQCRAVMSAVHWGEVAGQTCKARGSQAMDLVVSRLRAFGLQVVAADAGRAVAAALIKLKWRIPYMDAFGLELAAGISEGVFVTADFDFKAASADAAIEFLPKK